MKRILWVILIIALCAGGLWTNMSHGEGSQIFTKTALEPMGDQWSLDIDTLFAYYEDKLIPPSTFLEERLEPDGYVSLPRSMRMSFWSDDQLLGHYGTLRAHVVLNEDVVGKQLAILTGAFREDYVVYVNGKKVIDGGDVKLIPARGQTNIGPRIGVFAVDSNELDIIVHFSRHYVGAEATSGMKIGSLEQLQIETISRLAIQFIMVGAVVIMALYHFNFYFTSGNLRSSNRGSFYFGIMCLIIALRVMNIGDNMLMIVFQNLSLDLSVKLSFWSMYMMIPAALAFIHAIMPDYVDQQMIRINRIVTMLVAVIVILVEVEWNMVLIYPFILYAMIVISKVFTSLLIDLKNKNPKTRIVLTGFVLLVVVFSMDILYQFNFIEQELYLSIGLLAFTVIQSYYLSTRYNKAISDAKVLALENTSVLAQLEDMNAQLEETVDKRTEELEEAVYQLEKYSEEIKVLMDSVGQGFLSFDESFIIGDQYSVACQILLENDLSGKKISTVLYGTDLEQRLFFETIAQKIMGSTIRSQADLYMTLLPQDIYRNNRFLRASYRLVGEGASKRMVMTLTDITDAKQLEDQAKLDQSNLNMIVNIVVQIRDFTELLEDYQTFCSIGMIELMDSSMNLEELIFEVLRQIHTFKGSFAQYDMQRTVNLLHSLETEIMEIKENIEAIDRDSFRNIMVGYRIDRFPDKDLAIVRKKLGDSYLQHKNDVTISKKILLDIEDSIQQMGYSEQNQNLLQQLRAVRFRSFKSLLHQFPDYVSKLAEKTQKSINYIKIEGDDFLVDTDYYSKFTKSLVHVFRNMVDHGIEYDDERQAKDKGENGEITCRISRSEREIYLVIEDDGKGIDINNLRDFLFRTGRMSFHEAIELSDEKVLDVVFEPGFSTKTMVGELSGRGMGLSAVKTELERIHGQVVVTSKQGKGTQFRFTLPLIDAERVVSLPIQSVMKEMMEVAVRQIEHFTDLEVDIRDFSMETTQNEPVQLMDISAIIQIRGILDGTLILSVNHAFATQSLKHLGLEPEEDEDEGMLINDLVGEAANFLIGNVLRQLPDLKLAFRMDTPLVISHDQAEMQFTDYEIHRFGFEKNGYRYTASLIMKGVE